MSCLPVEWPNIEINSVATLVYVRNVWCSLDWQAKSDAEVSLCSHLTVLMVKNASLNAYLSILEVPS